MHAYSWRGWLRAQFVKTLVNTWYLGIYSVLKFQAMFSFKLPFASAIVPSFSKQFSLFFFSHSILVTNDPLYALGTRGQQNCVLLTL